MKNNKGVTLSQIELSTINTQQNLDIAY